MWNTVVSRWRWIAFALAVSLSGCTSMSDAKYELGQKIRTSQAWHEFNGCNKDCFTWDYQSGWKSGYYDVLTGGTGSPPVIAPSKYWKAPVLVEHDPSKRNDWYCGFQDGAACAKCQPDHHYLETFLPGPVCCPAPAVSCPVVPCEPAAFPLERVTPDPGVESAPLPIPENVDVRAADGNAPAADGSGSQPVQPAADVPKAEKPPVKDYDKDPEPTTSSTDDIRQPASEESLLKQMISLHQSTQPKPDSLLHQLVSNVSRTESDRNPSGEP